MEASCRAHAHAPVFPSLFRCWRCPPAPPCWPPPSAAPWRCSQWAARPTCSASRVRGRTAAQSSAAGPPAPPSPAPLRAPGRGLSMLPRSAAPSYGLPRLRLQATRSLMPRLWHSWQSLGWAPSSARPMRRCALLPALQACPWWCMRAACVAIPAHPRLLLPPSCSLLVAHARVHGRAAGGAAAGGPAGRLPRLPEAGVKRCNSVPASCAPHPKKIITCAAAAQR